MAIPTDSELIAALNRQYHGGRHSPTSVVLPYTGDKRYKAFIGSDSFLTISTTGSLDCKSPACFAAPVVHLIATRNLSIGEEPKPEVVPVRFFAPKFCTLTAETVSIGHAQFIEKPGGGLVTCKTLTLSKDSDPDFCEIVTSWTADDTEIIRKT